MRIRVYQTKLAEGLPLPARSHETDVGYDLATAVDFSVDPGCVVRVPTGLVFDLPLKKRRLWFFFGPPLRLLLQIEQRTGNGSRGLFPAATVVDPAYRSDRNDENGLTLALRNVSLETLSFKRGDRVMQGLFFLAVTPTLRGVKANRIRWITDRGSKRFGATGR